MLIGIFLFLKQIVDVIYELKVLDILMVVFALALIGVQLAGILKEAGLKQSGQNQAKQNVFALVKNQIKPIDYAVLILACLYALSFLRDMHAINSVVKIESAFLIYVLGRVYGQKIIDKGRCLAVAGYLVIYANLVYVIAEKLYIKQKGIDFPWEEHGLMNGGALYYYKTDLAIGLILASIFIYLYGRVKVLKFVTLYGATIYTIWDSKARMGKVILGSLLAIIFIREIVKFVQNKIEKKIDKKIEKNKSIGDKDKEVSSKIPAKIGCLEVLFIFITVAIIALFIAIQVTPIKQFDYYSLNLSEELVNKLEDTFHERHIIWWDTFHSMANQSIFTRFIGIDLNNFAKYNSVQNMSHCLYLNMFFAIGYLGIFAFVAFVYLALKTIKQVPNSDIRFAASIILFAFLIFGISMDPIEYTQISWFPFMFVGVTANLLNQ